MKELIDINEHNKNVIDRFVNGEGFEVLPTPIIDGVVRAVRNGTPIPDNATNEIMDIVNSPTKHIKIIKVDGEDTICYSQQFVKLLELLERTISERR